MRCRGRSQDRTHRRGTYREHNSRRVDQRLKWQGGETVRVLMAKVFPYDSGYMQTVTGRRKRLRAVLEPLLAESGWREIHPARRLFQG
jgi:hypothetical protein